MVRNVDGEKILIPSFGIWLLYAFFKIPLNLINIPLSSIIYAYPMISPICGFQTSFPCATGLPNPRDGSNTLIFRFLGPGIWVALNGILINMGCNNIMILYTNITAAMCLFTWYIYIFIIYQQYGLFQHIIMIYILYIIVNNDMQMLLILNFLGPASSQSLRSMVLRPQWRLPRCRTWWKITSKGRFCSLGKSSN